MNSRRRAEASARRRRREQRLGLLDAVPASRRRRAAWPTARRLRHSGRVGGRQRRARGATTRAGRAVERARAGEGPTARRGDDLPHEGARGARRPGVRPEAGARGVDPARPDRAYARVAPGVAGSPSREELADDRPRNLGRRRARRRRSPTRPLPRSGVARSRASTRKRGARRRTSPSCGRRS